MDGIRDVYPFLLAKRKQAVIAYSLDCSNKRGNELRGKGPLPQDKQQRRELLKVLIGRCNQREPVDVPEWCEEPTAKIEPGWWLRSDIIWSKCLSGGTVVYTRTLKGEMPATIKDIVRLDPKTVCLWDGEKWNQVSEGGAVPRGKNGGLEIEFRSGVRVGCTDTHKWPTQQGEVEAKNLQVGDIVTWVSLPQPQEPVRPASLDDQDVGWFIGLYLAEGSQSDGTLQFAGRVDEYARHDRLRRIATAFHGTCAVHQTSAQGSTANVNGPMLVALVNTYISGRTAHNKHLHPRCWSRNNDFLRALLEGYLSGDGHRRSNGSWRLGFTRNDQLATDIRTLAARLGASLRLRRCMVVNTGTGKRHKCWRGDIVMNPSDRRSPDGEVVAVRKSRARGFWNVSLTSAPHTFALASGICTKNSNPMPESVTDRPTKSHEYLFLLTKAERYFYDAEAIKEPAGPFHAGGNGNAMDSPHTPDPKKKQDALGKNTYTGFNARWAKKPAVGRNKRTVWTIATQPYKEAHFATFPEAMVTPPILAGTSERGCCPECGAPWERVTKQPAIPREAYLPRPKPQPGNDSPTSALQLLSSRRWMVPPREELGWRPTCAHYPRTSEWTEIPRREKNEPDDAAERGIAPILTLRMDLLASWAPMASIPCVVADPFAGSGTTGSVAVALGRRFIGVELNPSYIAMAKRRIEKGPKPTTRPSKKRPKQDAQQISLGVGT